MGKKNYHFLDDKFADDLDTDGDVEDLARQQLALVGTLGLAQFLYEARQLSKPVNKEERNVPQAR